MRANRSTLAKLCLLAALAVPVQQTASAAEASRTLSAQTSIQDRLALLAQAPTFTPPTSLGSDSSLSIDGASSMQAMNEALTQQFKARYADAKVDSATNGTDAALERLQAGEINLAAIGRPLTEAEKQAGLTAVDVAREKIAIFVGPENSFDGDLTFEQFGRIFRGEVTDWSQVGGQPGPIRFVDRPDYSDTRAAFNQYPTFQQASFETGANAEQVAEDDTAAVVAELGNDGISYAIANQVLGNNAVKIVPMHQTLPDDPAYPYSQPRSYVYFGEPTPAVEGFLAVATGDEGQAAVEEVRETEGAAAAQLEGAAPEASTDDGSLTARTNEDNVAVIEDDAGNLVAGPLAAAGGAVTALAFSPDGQTLATGTNTGKVRYWGVDGTPKGDLFDPGNGNAISALAFEENDKLSVSVANEGRRGLWGLNGLPYGEEAATGAIATANTDADADGVPWWLWLIPLLGLLGFGLWWLLGRDRDPETPEAKRQIAPTATVPPPATDPDSDREVSNRAQTVIKTDRVTDESRTVLPTADLPGAPSISEPAAVSQDQVSVNDPDLPEFESTDLEEPEIDDRNLDLRTAGLVGGAAVLGGAAVAGGAFALNEEEDDSDEDDDEYDENLDLTLDEPDSVPVGEGISGRDLGGAGATILEPSVESEPSFASSLDTDNLDTSNLDTSSLDTSSLDTSNLDTGSLDTSNLDASNLDASNLDDIEPTRDTVIAETDDILDIEPDSQTIIGDRTVIFRGPAANQPAPEVLASSLEPANSEIEDIEIGDTEIDDIEVENAIAPVGSDTTSDANNNIDAEDADIVTKDASTEDDSNDIDSFFASSDASDNDLPESREDTVEAGLSPVLEEPVLDSTIALGSVAAGIAGSTINTIPLRGEADRGISAADADEIDASEIGADEIDTSEIDANEIELMEAEQMEPEQAAAARSSYTIEELAAVDDDLPDLPEGYGESRIVLLPRDPKWAYAYWDVSNEHKEELRRQGGQQLALRLCDVTEIDQDSQAPHSMMQQNCDEMARSWYLEIPVSDRDYTAEIGYLTGDGRWLRLCRSAPIRVPPIYPSDWVNDQFVTIGFNESLGGRTFGELGRQPSAFDSDVPAEGLPPIYDELFAMTQGQNALRVAGSLFGSMQQVPPGALSLSGSVSGLSLSGLNVSGLNMSGVGMPRQRNFWLVADAELIVYGATEPNATLTVGDRVIPLTADGTFRFHVHFPDGKIDYPIRAVAADGEQERSITMKFERGTPERNTNTKEDAQDEWF